MKFNNKKFNLIILPVIIIIWAGLSCTEGGGLRGKGSFSSEKVDIKVGNNAPDFTGSELDGDEFTLSELADGKPVVLQFWATWCGPCRMEMPLVNEFAKKYDGEVTVLGITSEDSGSAGTIRNVVNSDGLVYDVVHDTSREISSLYSVTSIPFIVVIDAEGTIVSTHVGYSRNVVEELENDLGLT